MPSRRAAALRFALACGALFAVVLGLAWLMPQAEAQPFPLTPPAAAPSNCNYNINNNAPFLWEDIDPAVGGTGIPLAHGDYTTFTVTPSPWFQFYFCGTYYPSYTFVSEGFMCFEGALPSENCTPCCPYTPSASAPSASIGRPAVFPFYTDLLPGNCQAATPAANCVWWQVVGTAPNRRLIYEFKNVPFYNHPYPGPLSFEVKLFEGSGCFEVHYLQTANYPYQTLSGFQNAAGSAGWTHEWQAAGFTTASTAWSACPATPPPPPPPICTPSTQTVFVGQPASMSAGSGTPGYTWSAPGGSPASGSGSSFSTTYANAGTYTVTVTDSSNQSAQCRVTVTPPPCGYVFTPSVPYNFIDIGATGTTLGHGDDTSIDVGMLWQYWYCDQYHTVARTASNGYLCAGTSSSCTSYIPHTTLPNGGSPNGAIFGYWTDLLPSSCSAANCGTKWEVRGTTPNRVFIYSFHDVPFFGNGGANTFQFQLSESTHCVEVHYKNVQGNAPQRTLAGMENMAGSLGWTWRNTPSPGFVSSGEAWRICPGTPPPPPPPVCTPATQTVPVGSPATLTASWGVAPYGWVAPGGSPSSGGGSTFTTTYDAPGTYTVTVFGANDGMTTCTVRAILAGCGYDIESIPADWDEIAPTGNKMTSWTADTSTATITPGAGFAFKLCDGPLTSTFRISSKGHICLQPSVNCGNCCGIPGSIPSPGVARAAVMGYYSDLHPGRCGPGGTVVSSGGNGGNCIYWQVLGTAPNRRLVYEFDRVPYWDRGTTGTNTFQIKLFERSNCIEVHYMATSPNSGGYSTGAGFQNAAGNEGYQWKRVVGGGFSITTPVAWSACPPSLRLKFNEDQAPQLFDATKIQTGLGTQYNVTSWTQPAKGTLLRAGGKGNFTYQPFQDAIGTDTFDYTVTSTVSGAVLATGRVRITINPVNDAPSFTSSVQALVVEPVHRTKVVPGWGTLVRPAFPTAVDEAGQGITFTVTNTNPTLFDGPVTVQRTTSASDETASPTTTGTFALLRFTPAGGPTGTARICARPVDTGGTATVTNSWNATATGIDTGAERCIDIIVNAPPVAAFRPSTTRAAPRDTVAFDDCPAPAPDCTHDPDGAVTVWLWEFGDGATSSMTDPTHRYERPGTYTVRLTVWDAHGASATAVHTVTVEWPGAAPVDDGADGEAHAAPMADAGGNRTAVEGSKVTLTGSQRGGGMGTTFEWTQVGGPRVPLEAADTPNPTFTAPLLPTMEPVELVFGLRVADGPAVSPSDYAVITVVSTNRAPVAAAGGLVEAIAGDAVVVDGTASSDPDGDDLVYRWEQVPVVGEPMVAIADPAAPKLTFAAPEGRTSLHFRLTVSDGKATSEDQATVLVVPAPAPAPGGTARPEQAGLPAAEARSSPGQDLLPFVAMGAAFLAAAVLVAALVVRRMR